MWRSAPFAVALLSFSSFVLQMQKLWISSGEQTLQRHLQVRQVPADPEHQAEEDDEGPQDDEEIPETEGSEDPDEEQDEAQCIHEDGQEEKQQAAAEIAEIIHDESSRPHLELRQLFTAWAVYLYDMWKCFFPSQRRLWVCGESDEKEEFKRPGHIPFSIYICIFFMTLCDRRNMFPPWCRGIFRLYRWMCFYFMNTLHSTIFWSRPYLEPTGGFGKARNIGLVIFYALMFWNKIVGEHLSGAVYTLQEVTNFLSGIQTFWKGQKADKEEKTREAVSCVTLGVTVLLSGTAHYQSPVCRNTLEQHSITCKLYSQEK